MNGNERITRALNHEIPDRVPLDIGGASTCSININAFKKLLRLMRIKNHKVKLRNLQAQTARFPEFFYKKLGVDVRPILLNNSFIENNISNKEKRKSWFVDEWGRKWEKLKKEGHSYNITEFPLANKSVRDYNWPDPKNSNYFSLVQDQINFNQKNSKSSLLVRTKGNGFLQMGAQLFGYEKWFTMLGSNSEEVEYFLDRYYLFKKNFWEEYLLRFGKDTDIVCELDDLGTQSSTWISLDMYRNLIKPRQQKLFSFIKSISDVAIFFHSCGAIFDFIPDLIEVGVDILNPLQYTAKNMSLVEIKKEYGQEIVLWGGGIDTQNILPFGTPGDIKKEVKKNIEVLSQGGGYVFAPVHNIQSEVPPENIIAMMEAFNEFSIYPIC